MNSNAKIPFPNPVKTIAVDLLACVVPGGVIAVVIWFIHAKTVKSYPVYQNVSVTKSDRRYKVGYRVVGYQRKKVGSNPLPAESIAYKRFEGTLHGYSLLLYICLLTIGYIGVKLFFPELLVPKH